MVIWDDIIMMLLALVSGYLLVLDLTTDLSAAQVLWFGRIDVTIALVFLSEFVIKFFLAESKADFFRSNWWYLLASIPVSNSATQALRLLRLLRLIRLLRLVVGMREIITYLTRFVKQTYILYVLTVWAIIVACGSLVFYALEHPVNTNVKNLFDSLWFAMATITTVGYGDIYPLTVGGRIVGIVLMLCGIGTTGVFTALIASFLVQQRKAENE